MHTDKPTPMTDAERQRKHRQKRQRELHALRAVAPATPQERESAAHVQRLAAQLDKATRTAATLQARLDAMQAGEGDLQALREAVRALIPKLTPAAQQVVRRHLECCGAAQWLSPQTPPPQAAAPPSNLSSHVFF
ncbi:MAG: hypothetical protein KKB95_22260 [Gammaproteobacteria bacterium]|nr:hypothetical protein [Gammaproteobacteria bacterium]MBU1507278.1 hypothetical protein [Gammaproteobacteria bacterium]MBU2120887.1 hypothetical protein [Gammaproteobacteria bacterium]MBU2169602.1 hypothetical protein [Gammaproteobacteria bacterium]MBU2201727.1 hypothetical protein [Gammaproteobacteria bacterium]